MSVMPLSLDYSRLVSVHKPLFFCGVSPTDGDLSGGTATDRFERGNASGALGRRVPVSLSAASGGRQGRLEACEHREIVGDHR